MTEVRRLADLHAYVDDCLEPDERRAFEARMAADAALARRAAAWRAQNAAIRLAFDGEGPRTFSISVARHQNELAGKARRAGFAVARSSHEPPSRPSLAGPDASRIAAKVGGAGAFRKFPSWRVALGALSICALCVWSPAAPILPAQGLGAAAAAAFRAFVRPGVTSVDLVTGDRGQAQEWLSARLLHPVYLPFAGSDLRLLGARIAPYPGAPASFLSYSSPEGPLGLLIQSLDAPATMRPDLVSADGRSAATWTWRGQGFALVGDLEAASLLRIANDLFDSAAEAGQATPERGS